MKILMVSIPSIHFFRWINQLENMGYDIHWFDISGAGQKSTHINWVNQIVDWKLRYNFPGRYFLKNKAPTIYQYIQHFNEKETALAFEKLLLKIQPDVVHSFALYISCTPILEVMKKHHSIKWIYSSWGSDLYYFKNISNYLKDIKRVLPHVNYLFTDCQRDFEIAKNHGFNGKFLGVFPGGGGFDFAIMNKYKKPFLERKTILIKGFQGRSGRAIPVLKAIELIKKKLINYSLVVFGADKEVFEYVEKSSLKQWDGFYVKGKITQKQVWELMGKSIIYIGNSNSDGMPNTLLEAICLEVFPIQSNPGGATAEIITDGENGLLIEDCEDVDGISSLILKAIQNSKQIKSAISENNEYLVSHFEVNKLKNEINKLYIKVFEDNSLN